MKPRISGLLAIAAFVVACPLSGAQTRAQIAPVETVLYSFAGGSDGGDPLSGLIADERGALYGTTKGANPDCIDNTTCGTVFKLTPPAKYHTAWDRDRALSVLLAAKLQRWWNSAGWADRR